MRDLLDALDTRLAGLADLDAVAGASPHGRPGRQSHRRPTPQRRTLVGSLAAATGGIAAAFVLAGTSSAELPIFATPPTDATGVAGRVRLTEPDLDFANAHSFRTPGGPGYAVRGSTAICLIAPDPSPDAPGQYGGACDGPSAEVERRGLLLQLTSTADGKARLHVAFLLPEGATDAEVTSEGRIAKSSIDHGVVFAHLPRGGEIAWKVEGRRATQGVEPVVPERAMRVACPDGRLAQLEPMEAGPGDLREATKKACAR